MDTSIEKVSIIVSKGSLEGIYPALIMANGARAEGIEANLFFTFFGLDAINRKRHEHIKIATVGNPGLHLATLAGGLPGLPSVMTHYMERKMDKLDIPPIPEFIEMIADTGAGLYGCQASCDLFGLTKDDLIEAGQGHHHRGRVLCPRGRRPDHLHLTGPRARTGAWAVSQPPSLDLNTLGGMLGHHRRSARSTHVQPSYLRPLQEDHLDWLRPACGAGPRRGPAREPLHVPLKPASTPARPRARYTKKTGARR
jgi:peroxiredoxin family protein